MPKTTKELFGEWLDIMDLRWVRLNIDGRTIRQDFGPIIVRLHQGGIEIHPWENVTVRTLPFYEQARQFIKTTLEEARHNAAKKNVSLFESELRQDLAESEFMSEREKLP